MGWSQSLQGEREAVCQHPACRRLFLSCRHRGSGPLSAPLSPRLLSSPTLHHAYTLKSFCCQQPRAAPPPRSLTCGEDAARASYQKKAGDNGGGACHVLEIRGLSSEVKAGVQEEGPGDMRTPQPLSPWPLYGQLRRDTHWSSSLPLPHRLPRKS